MRIRGEQADIVQLYQHCDGAYRDLGSPMDQRHTHTDSYRHTQLIAIMSVSTGVVGDSGAGG